MGSRLLAFLREADFYTNSKTSYLLQNADSHFPSPESFV